MMQCANVSNKCMAIADKSMVPPIYLYLRYCVALLAFGLSFTIANAQNTNTLKSFYDDAGRLIKVIDGSDNEVDYVYDAAGNITAVTRGTAPGPNQLAILNFTPQTGGTGTIVNILGQNFSTTPSANTVSFNGAAGIVLTASTTTLTVSVPATATTGPVSVTVGSNTAKTTNNFNFVAGPSVASVSPHTTVNSTSATTISNFTVSGANLSGATFGFLPGFVPAPVTVTSSNISADGTSAVLSLSIAANVSGSFTLVATTSGGASSTTATTANTLNVLSPDADPDGDGLTNAVEIALGTDPLNPTTSGAGLPDGWQVFYGLNPLDPSVAGKDLDNSGLTVLQDFQQGLSPINPNRIPPAVSQITPANNATDVNINGVVVIRFAEPLLNGTTVTAAQTSLSTALGSSTSVSQSSQQTAAQTLATYLNRSCCGNSVIAGTVTLTGPDGAVPGSVTASNDSLSVTFATSQPLESNTAFTVQVNGLRDAAGNLMTKAFTSTYTTGSAIEFTPPTVSTVAPEYGLGNVPVNVHYTVRFSKAMDPATLTPANFTLIDYQTGLAVPGMIQTNADGVTASFIPNSPLAVNDTFTVELKTGLKDIYGNPLASQADYYFSTGDQQETAAPHVLAVSPANNASAVGTNALMNLLFSQPVSVVSVNSTNIQVTSGGKTVAVMMALSSGDQRLTLTPTAPLAANTQYTVTFGAGIVDLAGVPIDNPGTYKFTTSATADDSYPSIVTIDPSNGSTNVPLNAREHVTVSKPLDLTTVDSDELVLYPYQAGYGSPVAATIGVSSNGQTLTLTPASNLTPETQYCIYGTQLLDYEGHGVYASSCFTTGVTSTSTGPKVITMSPASGSTLVPLNAQISLGLDTPISFGSLGNGTLKVSAGGVNAGGGFTLSDDGLTLTYVTAQLAAGTTYTVTASGFSDQAGNLMTPFTGTFATASSAVVVNLSTGYDTAGNLILTGDIPDGQWVVTPTASTPAQGVFTATGTPQPLLIAAPGQAGFYSGWPANGPASSWVSINPDSVTGNTFGIYSTTFTIAGSSVPANLCLVGAMAVDDSGQLAINGQAIMDVIGSISSLSPINIPVSSYLTTGKNTLSLGWGSTDNSYEGFRLQAQIASCSATIVQNSLAVTSITPASGATNVPVNSTIVVTFNEPVNPQTINNQSVNVQAALSGGSYETIAGSYAVSGATVTFTPLTPLPGGASVLIYVNGYGQVLDLAGTSGQAAEQSFTTATTADTTAPRVLSVTPSNGATGIGLSGQVVVAFSKSMDRTTLAYSHIALLAYGKTISYNLSISADNASIALSGFTLPASTTITLAIPSGVTDISGNALANFTSTFTTGQGIDTTSATVANQRPANGATQIPTTASPVVLFVSKPLSASSLNGALHVAVNGQLVTGAIQLTSSGQAIEFTPSAPWPYGAVVKVLLDATAEDTEGNPVTAYQGQFTTVGDPATGSPQVTNSSPANGAQNVPLNAVIDLGYDQPISAATVIGKNVFLDGPAGQVAITLSLDASGKRITLSPNATLTASSEYCAYAYYLTGVNGSTAQNYAYCFYTGTGPATTAPTIVAMSPMDKQANVPVNANINIEFSAPIDPLSVSAATIQVSGGGQTELPVSLSFSNNNQTASFTPETPLPPATAMTVTVTGVTDLAGNQVATSTTHFTTGTTALTVRPTVVALNPPENTTDVPQNTVVSFQASAPLDPTSINARTFSLYDYATGDFVPGAITQSADGASVYLQPTSPLGVSRDYLIEASYQACCITDLAGNTLQQVLGSFTTGFGNNSTGPKVLGVSPSNGASNLPINVQVMVQFNEAIDPQSLGAVSLSVKGVPVPVQLSLTNGSQTLMIVPTAGLAANTAYTLNVSGVTDVAGTAQVAAFASSFSTGATVDLTTPSITLTDPTDSASDVPLNTLVRIAVNKPLNTLTVGPNTLVLYAYQTGTSYPVDGTLTLAASATYMTFQPSAALKAETYYCVQLTGVEDLEGNSLTQYAGCFTTGDSSLTKAPTVISMNPPSGTVGAPLNTVVQLGLSGPISTVAVSAGTFTVSSGSTAVPGTISISSDATSLSFAPTSNFAASTAYTVKASGFSDLANNTVPSFTGSFTTGTTTAAPNQLTVSSITPAAGATNVAVNTPIVVTFNAPINPLTVNDQSIRILVTWNDGTYSGTTEFAGTYAVNGNTVTFTPLSPLPGSATVYVYVGYYANVQDLAGNPSQSSSETFTTAATQDKTKPTVVSVTPTMGATGAGLNTAITIKFSKSMDYQTFYSYKIAVLAGEVAQSYSISVSSDNTTLVLSGFYFPASTLVTIAIPSSITDLSGNALADYTSTFTTTAAVNTTHANVTNQRPANGATGVSATASPLVLFVSEPLNASTVPAAVHVAQNGQLMTGTVQLLGDGQTIEFTPSTSWQYGALIQVYLDDTAEDTNGNSVTAYSGQFTITADPSSVEPLVVSYSPGYNVQGVPLNAQVDIGYTLPISTATVIAKNVYLNGPNGLVATTLSQNASGTRIFIKPAAVLAASSEYCAYAYNLTGTNSVAAQNFAYCFTTGTATAGKAPTIVAVSPMDKLTGVPLNANISAAFSGPIDPLSVDGTTVQVSGGGQTVVPVSLSFSNNNQMVSLTPQAPLPANTVMTLTIGGVLDAAGNAVAAQTTHFTTGSAPATATPTIVAVNPPINATGVPQNALMSIEASVPLDATTINSGTFSLLDATVDKYATGTITQSADGASLFLLPSAALTASDTYYLEENTPNCCIRDLAGNTLQSYNYSFTVGSTSSTAPQVTAVSPASGLTAVPINTQVTVVFNEPVDAQSLAGITLTLNGATVPISVSLSNGNQTLTLVASQALAPNATYTLNVNGVMDLSGNAMSKAYTSTFTTGGEADVTTPAVVTSSPANNATGVALAATVQVQFSKYMNATTLTTQTVTLKDSSNKAVSGTVTLNATATSLTFTPAAPLAASSQYTFYIGISGGVLDLTGTNFGGFGIAFTTGTQ